MSRHCENVWRNHIAQASVQGRTFASIAPAPRRASRGTRPGLSVIRTRPSAAPKLGLLSLSLACTLVALALL